MADAYGNIASNWRVWVGAWILNQDNNGATIRCVTHFQSVNNWRFSGLNANFGASVAGQTSSGSRSGSITVGTNGSMDLITRDQWVAKGHGAKNVGYGGYINVTGFASGSSSIVSTLSIPGKPSYTVSYDANGGGGQPGNQTKWWGENLNLSTARPTRSNYSFQGWSTSSTGGVNYQPGQTYSGNANLKLYAVWKLSYKPPTITSIDAYRCDDDGNRVDDGVKAKVTVKYSIDMSIDTATTAKSLVVSSRTGSNAWTDISPETLQVDTKGKGAASVIIDVSDTAKSYDVKAVLADTHGLSTQANTSVGTVFYLLDINGSGKGIGIGTGAPSDGVNITGMHLNFVGNDIKYNDILIDPQYAIYRRQNFNTSGSYQPLFLANYLKDWGPGDNAGCAIYDKPDTSDPSTFGISPSGKDFVIKKPGTYLLTGVQDISKAGDYNMFMGLKYMGGKGGTTVDGTRKLAESCPPLMAALRSDANQWYRWTFPPIMIKIPTIDASLDSIWLKPVWATEMKDASATTQFGSRTWVQIIKLPWSC